MNGAVHPIAFPRELTYALRQFCHREKSTLFNVLLTSFVVLLSRFSGEEDLSLGTIYGGRSRSELNSMIGCFVNTLILRTSMSGDPSFRELLLRVRSVTLSALDHADTPFHEVVRELELGRDGEPPIRAVFSYQPPQPKLPDEWAFDVFDVTNGAAKFDLQLELDDTPDALAGRLIFNSDLFDQRTVADLVEHWFVLLQEALREPERSVWDLPVLTPEEKRWMLEDLNDTRADFPDACVHELISRQAAKTPQRIAVAMDNQSLTYAELEHRSSQLAHHLRTQVKRGPRCFVGVMLERSPDILVAMLGIFKAGGTYVPLDPRYPAARIRLMLSSSEADLLITQETLIPSIPDKHCPVLTIEDFTNNLLRKKDDAEFVSVPPSTSAYVIFTSGSTGEPKGVVISHRSLTNLLWSALKEPGIRSSDTLLAVASICFDLAMIELLPPLLVGARVEMATANEAASPALLAEKYTKCNASILEATPTTWRMLIESGWKGSPNLKVVAAGEALTETLVEQLLQRCGSLWNVYGPTEITICCTVARVESSKGPIPLGATVANTTLYILDAHQRMGSRRRSGRALYRRGWAFKRISQ